MAQQQAHILLQCAVIANVFWGSPQTPNYDYCFQVPEGSSSAGASSLLTFRGTIDVLHRTQPNFCIMENVVNIGNTAGAEVDEDDDKNDKKLRSDSQFQFR